MQTMHGVTVELTAALLNGSPAYLPIQRCLLKFATSFRLYFERWEV